MSMPSIVCVAGPRQGQTIEITTQGLRLGRDESNDVPLDDPAVSRFHGRIILHNNAVWVQDAGSRNGIFVNGVRVTANKQVKPGDKVAIGEHVFLVELVDVDPEHSVSVNLSAVDQAALRSSPGMPPPLEKRWKLWPFAVAVLILAVLIGLVARSGGDAPVVVGDAGPPPGAHSLASALEAPAAKEAPVEAGAAPERMGLEDALAAASDESEALPTPPEGATVGELVDLGLDHQRAGRLREALVAYQMASQLEEPCEVCPGRIEKLGVELDAAIEEHFDAGLRYFNSLQYPQAIEAWEKVLLLEPDEGADVHLRTLDYLKKARAQLGG